jgi:hypothetical protein
MLFKVLRFSVKALYYQNNKTSFIIDSIGFDNFEQKHHQIYAFTSLLL